MLLVYPYKQVPVYWRRLLMESSLIITAYQLLNLTAATAPDPEVARKLIHDLDTAMVVSGAPGKGRHALGHGILDQVQQWLSSQHPRQKFSYSQKRVLESPVIQYPIERPPNLPSFTGFSDHVYNNKGPFVFKVGAVDHWPAFNDHPWSSIDYLLSIAADRVVPVEIGRSYVDIGWQQRMMRFEDFVEKHLIGSEVGYLAQHDLFYQIPRLSNDLIIPDYCFVSPPPTSTYTPPLDVLQNAWLGPVGTITPLHHDPFHNILVQVVGRKYIRLYAPDQSEILYPHDGIMANTSQVDTSCPDLQRFPRFKEAVYTECVLSPGEMLYIPPKWWHDVRSLEMSFSVSFWF
ncbi:hypothetical protein F4703DRAFT_1831837 [Phycomyces blakesleeanus]